MVAKKKLRFDQQVIDVLRDKAAWSEDGLQVKLEPLPRDIYDKVAKALKAMGGKWKGGKTQATVFESDPRGEVEGLLATGVIEVERDGYFPTPKEVTVKTLLPLADIQPVKGRKVRILEPEAGMGAIAAEIVVYLDGKGIRYSLDLCEKNEKRAAFLEGSGYRVVARDFLEYDPGEEYDYIVMNPPFEEGQDCVHVMHAYNMLEPGGVLVAIMGANLEYRTNGKYKIFKEWVADKLKIKDSEVLDLPENAFKESGTNVGTMVIRLIKPAVGSTKHLEQIAKGDPNKKATAAAKRVLAKRAARKYGGESRADIAFEEVDESTVIIGRKSVGKSEFPPEELKPVKSNDKKAKANEPRWVGDKVKHPEPSTRLRPDGKIVLTGGVSLPDPHTERLAVNADTLIDDMNQWFRWYATMPSYFKNDQERDQRVRQDFAAFGAFDKSIVFDPQSETYNRVEVKKKR